MIDADLKRHPGTSAAARSGRQVAARRTLRRRRSVGGGGGGLGSKPNARRLTGRPSPAAPRCCVAAGEVGWLGGGARHVWRSCRLRVPIMAVPGTSRRLLRLQITLRSAADFAAERAQRARETPDACKDRGPPLKSPKWVVLIGAQS